MGNELGNAAKTAVFKRRRNYTVMYCTYLRLGKTCTLFLVMSHSVSLESLLGFVSNIAKIVWICNPDPRHHFLLTFEKFMSTYSVKLLEINPFDASFAAAPTRWVFPTPD